jgi:cell division septation protein DedD
MHLLRRLLLLLVTVFITTNAVAQAPPEVVTDVKVLEVDRSTLRSLALLSSAGPLALVVNITQPLAVSLAEAQGSRTLQNFQLTTTGNNPAQFRVASRVQALDAGVDFQLTSKVSVKREIAMQISSQVRILDAGPVFTGQTVTQTIMTAEGASVLIGGFVTGPDSTQLTKIGTLQKSPLLNYVFSTEDVDEPEIVLVLTPRITRPPSAATAVDVVEALRAATPPPPPPPPVPPSVEPSVERRPSRYTIQVASFRSEARAKALVDELSAAHYADPLVMPPLPPQTFYRVRVGRLADLQAARELYRQLTAGGFEPLIVRLK